MVGAKGLGSLPFPLNGDLPWFTGSPSWANKTPTEDLICVDMTLASGGSRRVPNDGYASTGRAASDPSSNCPRSGSVNGTVFRRVGARDVEVTRHRELPERILPSTVGVGQCRTMIGM